MKVTDIRRDEQAPREQRFFRISLALALSLALMFFLSSLATGAGVSMRASTTAYGDEANAASNWSSSSANGQYVAFGSNASNLVYGDKNGIGDVFLKDTQTGTTTRVSTASNGGEANGGSSYPAISADGRYVAFMSYASNLVPGDRNGAGDIFLKDTQTGTTTRVSTASNGGEANGGSEWWPSISADGRYVAFMSYASNLVDGDKNSRPDVFVKDIQTGTTTRISIASNGGEANGGSYWSSISANGRYVAFGSYASNLVYGDDNETGDIFLKDAQTGTTTRISIASNGGEANGGSFQPSISADGRYVAFMSYAFNLVSGDKNGVRDIFIKDTRTGTMTRASTPWNGGEANGGSYWSSISADGRYVAFDSEASNLVQGDGNGRSDVYIKDMQAGTITRVSSAWYGSEANSHSFYPSISGDGRYVAFDSLATNLVWGDANGTWDIFVASTGVEVCASALDLPEPIKRLLGESCVPPKLPPITDLENGSIEFPS